jgi:hypothetical protein
MNENPASHSSVFETNDSLEAVSVFRTWKNIFFGILLVCLLLTQVAFWLINLKIVTAPAVSNTAVSSPAAVAAPGVTPSPAGEAGPADTGRTGFFQRLFAGLNFERTARTVELVNGILLVAAVLLVASIFFALMVSLVGRLGGLNHISRAFILTLIAVVLLVPWQLLGLNVLGVTWTPDELIRWLPTKGASLGNAIIFYLRFTGYWVAIMLLVLLSQARSTLWSKSMLRRLEII